MKKILILFNCLAITGTCVAFAGMTPDLIPKAYINNLATCKPSKTTDSNNTSVYEILGWNNGKCKVQTSSSSSLEVCNISRADLAGYVNSMKNPGPVRKFSLQTPNGPYETDGTLYEKYVMQLWYGGSCTGEYNFSTR